MRNLFKRYVIIWFVFLATFNVICFVFPNTVTIVGQTYSKFGGAFWVGYIFITLAFIGQLLCAFRAFNTDDKTRFFYNVPLISVSYTGLILTFVFGALCFAIPKLPNWVGNILCFTVLAFSAIAVIKADTAADVIGSADKRISAELALIKGLAADAESLVAHAGTEEAKAACKKVYEALRYSDPMSSDALTEIENVLSKDFEILAAAVKTNNSASIGKAADVFLITLGDRNGKCRALKEKQNV